MASDFAGLLKTKAFLCGQWVGAETGDVFDVANPADSEKIGSVPDMGRADALRAVAFAQEAFPAWKAQTGKERAAVLHKWFELIRAHAENLARLLTLEQGKPLAESRAEVLGGAALVEWFSEEAKRVYGDFVPAHKRDARIIVSREAVGVVGAITPWNFPSAMIARKVSPALAAGCTVVLKPAEDTPFSALALAALAQEAGFPAGIFNVVTASLKNTPEIGDVLTEDRRIKKISFTGSTAVGKLLMEKAAPQIKKLSLELGGNAPFIVFPSADLAQSLDGAMACKFRNAGQACTSANRIYVHASLYDEFSGKLVERVKDLCVGKGDQQGTTIGPLINEEAVRKVEGLVSEALAQGAKLETGGDRCGLGYAPTVLTGMKDTMRIAREEVFGPVAALFSFEEEEDVIHRANDTEYGLASYIYSRDYSQIWRVSDALEYGMVAVNEPLLATELAPFGGIKESGIGREGGNMGLEEFTDVKYRLFGGV